MYVNNINLENATLEDAVQALKGAKVGKVQIGVAKPLPVRDSIIVILPSVFISKLSDQKQT